MAASEERGEKPTTCPRTQCLLVFNGWRGKEVKKTAWGGKGQGHYGPSRKQWVTWHLEQFHCFKWEHWEQHSNPTYQNHKLQSLQDSLTSPGYILSPTQLSFFWFLRVNLHSIPHPQQTHTLLVRIPLTGQKLLLSIVHLFLCFGECLVP